MSISSPIFGHSKSDLPNELLDLILHHVDDEDLLSVAVLCARLHTIAIKIYFTRMKIVTNIPFRLTLGGATPFHALRGVRLAFGARDLHHIDCKFTADIVQEMEEVQRLLRLNKILAVKSFSLGFSSWQFCGRQLFIRSVASLLDDLCRKSCTSFTASGDLCATTSRSAAGQPIGDYSIRTQPLVNLKSTSLILSVFVSPPFRSWMTQSLNMSPITQLRLIDHREDLHSFLAPLELPSLSIFHISSRTLAAADLVMFLNRHPSITHLTVDIRSKYQFSRHTPKYSLPQLATVISRADFIIYLLTSPSGAPKLVTVRLSSLQLYNGGSDQPVFSLSALRRAVALIAKCNNIRSLALVFEDSPEIKNWLQVGKHPRVVSKEKRCLPHISKLSLTFLREDDIALDIIPRWLRLFPALQVFTIVSKNVPGSASTTKGQRMMLAETLRKACPPLTRISFRLD